MVYRTYAATDPKENVASGRMECTATGIKRSI